MVRRVQAASIASSSCGHDVVLVTDPAAWGDHGAAGEGSSDKAFETYVSSVGVLGFRDTLPWHSTCRNCHIGCDHAATGCRVHT